MLLRLVENQVAPAQCVSGGARHGHRQYWQDEDLRVPEGVAVVAGTRQSFRWNGAPFPTRPRLQDVEERETYRLLDLGIALQFDVCTRPDVVQVGPLLGEQALPAGQARGRQCGPDLIVDGRPRTQTRPAVGNELDDAQPLARLQPRGGGHTGDIGDTFGRDDRLGWPLDAVVHRHPDAQAADPGMMDQEPAGALRQVLLTLERGLKSGAHPGILTLRRERLVCDQLRLHYDTHWSIQRLDLVANGRDGPLGERHQAHGRDLDHASRRGGPANAAAEYPTAKVEFPLVVPDFAIANVKGLVVDEQADEFAVGDIDGRLPGLGVGVSTLGIGQRAQLVEGVEVGAGKAVRLPLVEVAPQSDMSVGEGENGFGLRQGVEVESRLADTPLLDREGRMFDHRRPPISVLLETMMQKSALLVGKSQVRGSGMSFSLMSV